MSHVPYTRTLLKGQNGVYALRNWIWLFELNILILFWKVLKLLYLCSLNYMISRNHFDQYLWNVFINIL